MTEHNITLAVGATKVLHTAGTYCDRDIVVTAEKGDGYENGYNDGLEAGKKAECDAFWDAYQDGGNRTNWDRAYNSLYWSDANYNPKYDMNVVSGLAMFGNMKISDTKVAVDISNATNISSMFNSAATLTTIRKLIVSETTPFQENVFAWASSLENITFEGTIGVSIAFANSSRLTTASVNSIINALKDLTGQTAQTLTFHATVGGELTDEQKAAITAKNWTLVY